MISMVTPYLLDVALQKIVDGAVEHFGHHFELGLRDVSVNHPVVDGFTSNSQSLSEGFNGQLSPASFCIDVRVEQFRFLLSV